MGSHGRMGSTHASYSRDSGFKPQHGHWLTYLRPFVILLSTTRQALGDYLTWVTTACVRIPPDRNVKSKSVPVIGRRGPYGCETSRFPRFPDNRLTDGGKVVSLKRPPPFYHQEDSWYSFLFKAESTPGP
jgi:hypothetical protein